jgi:hypothetical protein
MALEISDKLLGKNLRDEAHAFVHGETLAVGACDTGAFLPAMLERVEAEKRKAAHIEPLAVHTEDCALFAKPLHHVGIVADEKARFS